MTYGQPLALPETEQPTLHVEQISKTFHGTRVLDDVRFTVKPGEVHGLLGANGSGKSTMIKVLAGAHAPDVGGRMYFNGKEVTLPLRPNEFRKLGMSFVHQNLGLIPTMTVLENLRLSAIAVQNRTFINWKAEIAAAEVTLARYGVDIVHWQSVGELTAVNRALLAIVRAFEEIREQCEVTGQPGLVLLDEPTPFLPTEGVKQLFDLMRQIAATGSSVVFISHDIDEVMEITDRLTVLRDGRVSGEIATEQATRDQMIEMIIGRTLMQGGPKRTASPTIRQPFLQVRGLVGKGVGPTKFTVGKGEILGLTGLIGSGFDHIPYLLFGADGAVAGTIINEDGVETAVADMTPAKAIAARYALLPGDRAAQSGVGLMTVFENMLLPGISDFFRGGFLRAGAMRREAHALGARFEVRPNDPEMALEDLSGGNAQKVLIARWMKRDPDLLLLDEPTQGVDVGTRAHIFSALNEASRNGMSIVCASSDAEQLAEICDRVLVFARGKIVVELIGDSISKDHIVHACYTSMEVDGNH